MASETYYFLFSEILVLGIMTHLVNMLYFRLTKKTIFGKQYKTGTPPYEALSKLSGNRKLTIAILLALLFVSNLIFDVYRLLHLRNAGYGRGMLVYGSAATIALFFAAFVGIKAKNSGTLPRGN